MKINEQKQKKKKTKIKVRYYNRYKTKGNNVFFITYPNKEIPHIRQNQIKGYIKTKNQNKETKYHKQEIKKKFPFRKAINKVKKRMNPNLRKKKQKRKKKRNYYITNKELCRG
jgi:hypothetical protein